MNNLFVNRISKVVNVKCVIVFMKVINMALNTDYLKERLREAFGSDSQETIGKKLNMTQGNVSKLLSGVQQPTLDTLYRIATVYDVSVDWIMGLSDRKKAIKPESGTTYGLAVETIQDLVYKGSDMTDKERGDSIEIKIKDPILVKLLKKSQALSKADWEMFKEWRRERLSIFDDRPIVWTSTFSSEKLDFLAGEAVSEANLLEVYEVAKKEEEEYAALMEDNHSPFKD